MIETAIYPSLASARVLRLLPALLLVGGALNGLVARVVDAWAAEGLAFPFMGVGPFQLLAIAVAASLLARPADVAGSEARAFVRPAELAFLGLMLVPSSTVAWVATGAYALVHAARTRGGERAGALLLLALALSSVWSAVGMQRLAVPITTFEAWVTAALLGLVRGDIVQAGNVVGVPQGHSLVILAACSGLSGLPGVLLGTLSVTLYLEGHTRRRLVFACLGCAAVFLLANQARLLLMAWSSGVYEIVHGPAGANVFDLLQTLLALAAGTLAARR